MGKTRRKDPEHPVKRQNDKKRRRWDPVDETSWESFPASDPPSWAASTVDRPARDDSDSEDR